MNSPQPSAQHTAGPWIASDNAGCRNITAESLGYEIAYTTGIHDDAEDEANARPIAAAPAMHAECRAVIAALRDFAVKHSAFESEIHALAERLYNVTIT